MKPLSDCRLYAFVDLGYVEWKDAEDVARQLCDGGADLVQLRAKAATVETITGLAEKLLSITDAAGVGLVLNDYPSIARSLGLPVCHLGQEDFFEAGFLRAEDLRGQPPAFKLGLSTHAPAEALRALQAAPDYIAIGPIYATGTKPSARPVTLEYVHWAAAHVPIPWFAIGGINLTNLEEVVAAGATRICVVSAILQAPKITEACQEFRRRLLSAAPQP